MLIAFPNVRSVNAEEIIYIAADGSVEGTNMIQRDGKTYTLTASIYERRMIVETSNIVIDGNGHTFSGYPSCLYGIYMVNVENVTIKNFVIKNCLNGIFIENSTHVTVLGNKIAEIPASPPPNPSAAIILRHGGFHSIIGNNITGNYIGIRFSSSSNNTVNHNNFINNDVDVYDPNWYYPQSNPSTSIWDNGYPSGGNYWSNYEGTDLYSGVYQNETGSDGIGDTPCVFIAENEIVCTDHYPLMEVVPAILEFPSWVILPLLLTASLTAIIYRTKLCKKIEATSKY